MNFNSVKPCFFCSSCAIAITGYNFPNSFYRHFFWHVRTEGAWNGRWCFSNYVFAGLAPGMIDLRNNHSIMLVDSFCKLSESGNLSIIP